MRIAEAFTASIASNRRPASRKRWAIASPTSLQRAARESFFCMNPIDDEVEMLLDPDSKEVSVCWIV